MKHYPVSLVTGPRQSGKTTLVRLLGEQGGYHYDSFDSVPTQAAALRDPVGFVSSVQKPAIFDEVQRVPELFLPIKVDVDNHRLPGRYILTGSTNPLLAPKLGDALTGRMALHHLWTLSQGEIRQQRETFLERVFAEDFGMSRRISCSRGEILRVAVIGGFPAMQKLSHEQERQEWCDNYVSLALQKDIQDLARIEGIQELPNLLCTLATRVGSLMNFSDISNATGISSTTLRRYIQLLHSLFLIYTLPPWSSNIRKRINKAPKIYFADSAILVYLLKMSLAQIEAMPLLVGSIFENFVAMELVRQLSWNTKRIEMFHGRLSSGTEVDFVLEDSAGKIVGIEVKSSETARADDFKNFQHLKEAARDKFLRGIILYSGAEKLPFGNGNWAVPISDLWSET
jgi:hypothetical protein